MDFHNFPKQLYNLAIRVLKDASMLYMTKYLKVANQAKKQVHKTKMDGRKRYFRIPARTEFVA